MAGVHLATPPVAPRLERSAWIAAHEAHRDAIARALATTRVDVVHLHGVDFDHYLPPPGPPALVTLHLPASYYAPAALAPARPRTFLHCVSASQRAAFPPGVRLLEDVPNGVDLGALRPARTKRAFALALGRVCPEKGFHLALDAAARAGVPLVLAGAVHPFPEHVRYFRDEIAPRLGRRRWFVGPVAGERKRRLLAGARCLLVSSVVPETCSLVALEALASGTPVVAFRRGALPELVEHGRTGFLVDTVEEMAAAIGASGALSPAACRRAAEARFPASETAARYLALYEQLAAGLAASGASPSSRSAAATAPRHASPRSGNPNSS